MTPVTELVTARLRLRLPMLADLDDCAAMWADPEVVRFVGSQVSSREQAWARLLRYVGHWELLGYGFWVAVDRETGRHVGEVGVARFERDIVPPVGDFEAGWVLARWAHRRGLATEAMAAVLAWTDARFPGQSTTCLVDLGNTASHRVAGKLGYHELCHREYLGTTCVLYERSTI